MSMPLPEKQFIMVSCSRDWDDIVPASMVHIFINSFFSSGQLEKSRNSLVTHTHESSSIIKCWEVRCCSITKYVSSKYLINLNLRAWTFHSRACWIKMPTCGLSLSAFSDSNSLMWNSHRSSVALRSRRRRKLVTKLFRVLNSCSVSPRERPRSERRRAGTDLQRWRQRRERRHVWTASCDGRSDSMCYRASSGRTSIPAAGTFWLLRGEQCLSSPKGLLPRSISPQSWQELRRAGGERRSW